MANRSSNLILSEAFDTFSARGLQLQLQLQLQLPRASFCKLSASALCASTSLNLASEFSLEIFSINASFCLHIHSGACNQIKRTLARKRAYQLKG